MVKAWRSQDTYHDGQAQSLERLLEDVELLDERRIHVRAVLTAEARGLRSRVVSHIVHIRRQLPYGHGESFMAFNSVL